MVVTFFPVIISLAGLEFQFLACVSNQNKIYVACTLFRRRNENVQHFLRNVFVILNLTSEASDEAYALAGWTLLVASLSGDAFVVL